MQKNGEPQSIGEASRRLRGDLNDLYGAVTRSKEDLGARLGSYLRERPYGSLAIAFGIGYVLGGGLFSRASSRLLGIGARVYGLKLARNLMGQALHAQPSRP
jgi:hypothetical protein